MSLVLHEQPNHAGPDHGRPAPFWYLQGSIDHTSAKALREWVGG